jgi:hypothetical protein
MAIKEQVSFRREMLRKGWGLRNTPDHGTAIYKADKAGSSDLHVAKVGNTGFHHFQVHFDEVVL